MNSSKSFTGIMLAGTAAGELLPAYVVYKADKSWDTWTENGPIGARYNRSQSGWFDHACFEDWFEKVALSFCNRKSGRCVLTGDNLSSHFSPDIIKRDVEAEAVEVVLFLWKRKRKREKSTASAST